MTNAVQRRPRSAGVPITYCLDLTQKFVNQFPDSLHHLTDIAAIEVVPFCMEGMISNASVRLDAFRFHWSEYACFYELVDKRLDRHTARGEAVFRGNLLDGIFQHSARQH